VLGPHSDHWIVGAGTYDIKNGNQRQMYRCKWCKKRFECDQNRTIQNCMIEKRKN